MAAEDKRHRPQKDKYTRDADGNLTPRSAFHAKLAAAHAAPKPESRYKGAKGVTGGYDGRCFLWNLAKPGNIIRNLTGHSAYVRSIDVSRDGNAALSASDDGTVRLWDLITGNCSMCMVGHESEVKGACLSQDKRHALSGGTDRTVRLWDANTGKCVRVMGGKAGGNGHKGTVNDVSMVEDENTGQPLFGFSASSDKSVGFWDLRAGSIQRIMLGHSAEVHSVTATSTGRRCLTTSFDATLKYWSVPDGLPLVTLRGHQGSVYAGCISSDGGWAISGGFDQSVRLWEIDRGLQLILFEGHEAEVTGVSMSNDMRNILSSSLDGTIRYWDARSGSCVRTLRGHTDWISCCCMTPAVKDGLLPMQPSDGEIIARERAEERRKAAEEAAMLAALKAEEEAAAKEVADRKETERKRLEASWGYS